MCHFWLDPKVTKRSRLTLTGYFETYARCRIPTRFAQTGMLRALAAVSSPRETVSMEYALEYGTGTIELHKDSIKPGQKVVIIDDLIATGGTVEAIAKLVEELGGEVVKICFVMELAGLKGREKLQKYDVDSAIIYEGK